MVFMDWDNRIALQMSPMFVILLLLTLYRCQLITNITTLLQVSIVVCIRATYVYMCHPLSLTFSP
jgi:hypothetical protein